jgi:transglutaminase-like putative cysteine protease
VTARVICALPFIIGALALGSAAQAWLLSAVLVVGIAALAVTGPRWELDGGRQFLTSAIGASVGYLGASLLHEAEPGRLSDGWARLAAAALLAAATRFLILGARGGYMPSLALAFLSVVASGKTHGHGYAVFAVCFLLASLWAITQRPGLVFPAPSSRRAWLGALVLLTAASIGLGSTLGLRKLHAWATQRARFTAYDWKPQVGFSDRMDLGALDALLDSDQRVLRVRGPRVDYLRGAALDRYEAGRWLRSEAAEPESKVRLTGVLPTQGVVEITATSERATRFFIPLEAQRIVTEPGQVLVDSLGSVKRESKRGPAIVRFVPGARQRARPAPPRFSDLQIPRRLRPRLEQLAAEWTEGATTPAEKLGAIERRLLAQYTYARAFTRPTRTDPLIDFLFENRRGHCEYFASALALVARAAGVPTRVVLGYRVAERSPFGYYVVRERNAHAWVEAWLPGSGWATHDATPEAFLPHNRGHEAGYGASSLDAVAVAYDDLTDWLGGLSVAETSAAWLLGSLLLALIVARGARERAHRSSAAPDEAPLPFLEPLLSQLARAGHTRRPDEPLERLATRVSDPLPAGLLHRYAALRYGGLGDADQLARDVAACAPLLRRNGRKHGNRLGSRH